MFRKIKGQDHTIDLLRKAIENKRIAQAYLFHGSDGVGKFMTALYFGMAVNCYGLEDLRPCGVCESCHKFLSLEHPDFVYLFPTPNFEMTSEGEIKKPEKLKQYQAFLQNKIHSPWADFFFKESTEIRRDNVAMLIKRLELSIHEARFRIVIIEDADQMNTATANAFLKTLEEPPANTVIILITERLQMLLPTILSRTQPLYFKPLSRGVIESILADQFDTPASVARTAARISAGNLKTAIRIASETTSVSRDWAFEIVDLAAKQNDLGFYTLLDKNRELRSKDMIEDVLKYMRIIAGDLALLSVADSADISNIDKVDFFIEICNTHQSIEDRAHDYLLSLEDLSRKIDGNVNLNLVLINLYYRTKRFLTA
ncbi:MAG: DNA polymerase III subunit [Candidatus Cloacimonetes bacterium]|nr:DNA polymerase III subunit [Candidatus Cloacimonadota bacterium]